MNRRIVITTMLIGLLAGCKAATSLRTAATNTAVVEAAQANDDPENGQLKLTVMKLSDKEWQEIQESYNKITHADDNWTEEDGDADMLAGVLNNNDISIGGKLEYYTLKQCGFKFIPDSAYLDRIKQVFGIDLNNKKHLRSNKLREYDDYAVYLIPYDRATRHEYEGGCEFYSDRHNSYFFRKYGIVLYDQPLATAIDMEHSLNKDSVYVYNKIPVYHWNNYILHGNRGSLAWLKNNGYIYSLQQLFYFFGYDKEEMINKSILDELGDDPVSNYPRTFVGWDIEENLQIREGLLKTIENNSTASDSKYYTIATDFMDYFAYDPDEDIPEDDYRRQFTAAERRKVIAYMINTVQPLYEKYNGNDGYGLDDKYFIGIEDTAWNILFNDHELLRQIEANDCYGLPNLTALIQKMRKDDRFVNPQTGVLEPWSWSPASAD